MGKPLTTELVLMRSKAERLENVKNLNLWGNELEDVQVLRNMPNVEILSLSVNKINTLRDFRYCSHLTELYLRKNLIADINEIRYLQGLPNLKVLWLMDNPCAEQSDYRAFVIRNLPNLEKLDSNVVTAQEKSAYANGSASVPIPSQPSNPPSSQISSAPPLDTPPPRREPPRSSSSVERRAVRKPRTEAGENRNENILCAVLALLKELDENGLEIIRRDIDRKLSSRAAM